jgi:hypothetical protein
MKNISFKAVLPHLTAIILFLIIALVYFSPVLEGKKILQSDIVHHQGVSKEINDYRNSTGKEPLWTNSMFGGMPAYQISVRYTANLIGYLDKVFMLGLPHPVNYLFLYFFGFYIFLLVMGVNPWLSIAGAVGFGLSSFFLIVIEAGHNSQAHAIGYLPLVLAGICLTFRRKYLIGGIVTAVFLSLEMFSNHPQIAYYMVMIAVLIGISELIGAIRSREFAPYLRSVGVIMIAVLFALLTNITSLWATYEYGKYTIRGASELSTEKENRTSGLDKNYATQWSYGIGETMTLLIPNFYGGTYQKLSMNSAMAKTLEQNNYQASEIMKGQEWPMYWGAQPFTSGPVYVGAIIVFLFVLGLIIVKGPVKWWLLAGTILSVMLAWGHNFMSLTDFFLTYVPGYNKFRSVTMILVIAEVTMPLLGILALKEVFNPVNDRKKLFKSVLLAFYITGGICLFFGLLPGMFLDFTSPDDKAHGLPDFMVAALIPDRKSMLIMDSFRSFAFIALAAGLLWAILFKKIKPVYGFPVLILLILVDLFAVDKRYVNDDDFTSKSKVEQPFEMTRADQQILQDKSLDYRVLNLNVGDLTGDFNTSYFHKSIGGYHGAKLRRYQELLNNGIDPDIRELSKSQSTVNTPVLNMLNTKYFIAAGQDKVPFAIPNPNALSNAWFVNNYRLVDSPDAELAAISHFNPRDEAIVDKSFSGYLKGYVPGRSPGDTIFMNSYAPNDLVYTYRTKQNGFAVFSEIYYPKGWNAYLDGKLTDHFRVNYVLRAMILPAGEHKVEFKFEPAVYFVGEKISFVSSLFLIALIVLAGLFEIRKATKAKA